MLPDQGWVKKLLKVKVKKAKKNSSRWKKDISDGRSLVV